MFQTVDVPIWLLALIVVFAAVTFASHFLFPSVRWFVRRRAERLVARMNKRLARPIEPFKLARRHDMIQRLIYDTEVNRAIHDHARRNRVPENVAFELARRHAREIVPRFSATVYFSFGIRVARWLSHSLYRVRIGALDRGRFDVIDPGASVVFVMNHRSNMDYVLVTWLVSRTSTLSYAVGEWARVWPMSALVRAMGAYFIRRKDRSALYRRVLARYVQMSVEGGVTQAIFPEGGLSLTGRLAPPKLGLLSYIADEALERDVIFVPVGLNYDRVLEDRILIAADPAHREFRPPFGHVAKSIARHVWLRMTRQFKSFGTASVGFGTPLSLKAHRAAGGNVEGLAEELMARIAAVVPPLPVPLVSRVMLGQERGLERAALIEAVGADIEALSGLGQALPRRDPRQLVDDALEILAERRLLVEERGLWRMKDGARPVLTYYADSIAHHFAPELQLDPAPIVDPVDPEAEPAPATEADVAEAAGPRS
ncbi:1-acyl-sn-glycerol-3-phosphate acyltransferase [Pseudoroseicyclus tamaricis]|uniref:Glycerol-3-phosphate acyltransferase n=1 Tax=Pseudoroseicyclus tamaricis TaxID=2705421 RepID=A0A6B2JFW4_9RHOB|nr:1-acyl-sn-glycerol-3-phosphate acyltransferase [Pseudoroseicyclus tamaricis]NDU99972.1 glycerol-3-phosphate acyltransferase [Pseudoroseicyclus tamaricis]